MYPLSNVNWCSYKKRKFLLFLKYFPCKLGRKIGKYRSYVFTLWEHHTYQWIESQIVPYMRKPLWNPKYLYWSYYTPLTMNWFAFCQFHLIDHDFCNTKSSLLSTKFSWAHFSSTLCWKQTNLPCPNKILDFIR